MRTIPSITFLIGGKFSQPATGASREDLTHEAAGSGSASFPRGRPALLRWYRPCKPTVYSFYRFAAEQWGNVYGQNPYGAIGFDGEAFFGWDDAGKPTYEVVRRAVEQLLERCRRLRGEFGTRRFRFVAHSGGCWVANMATHHADFDIDQLILCSPSVPRASNIPKGWTRQKLVEAFPNVERLAAGKFFYFSVWPDTVLAYLRRDTTYATPLVEREFPAVFAAARTPGPLRTIDLLLGHWRTVHPGVWMNPPNLGGESYLDWIARQ